MTSGLADCATTKGEILSTTSVAVYKLKASPLLDWRDCIREDSMPRDPATVRIGLLPSDQDACPSRLYCSYRACRAQHPAEDPWVLCIPRHEVLTTRPDSRALKHNSSQRRLSNSNNYAATGSALSWLALCWPLSRRPSLSKLNLDVEADVSIGVDHDLRPNAVVPKRIIDLWSFIPHSHVGV